MAGPYPGRCRDGWFLHPRWVWSAGAAAVGLLMLATYLVPQWINARFPDGCAIEPGTTFEVGGFRHTPDPT